MRKALVVFIAMAIMSVCCISCETVEKGVSIETGTSYES